MNVPSLSSRFFGISFEFQLHTDSWLASLVAFAYPKRARHVSASFLVSVTPFKKGSSEVHPTYASTPKVPRGRLSLFSHACLDRKHSLAPSSAATVCCSSIRDREEQKTFLVLTGQKNPICFFLGSRKFRIRDALRLVHCRREHCPRQSIAHY
mgnify:CR=1 FL=1